jgi:hypothetical protein
VGIRHIAQLLERPGDEVDSLYLARAEAEGERAATSSDTALGSGLSSRGSPNAGLGVVLDVKARRLLEAQRIEMLARVNAGEATEKDQDKLDEIEEALAKVKDVGSSDTKKAANTVSRAISRALEAIEEATLKVPGSEGVWRHLNTTIETGRRCRYCPTFDGPIGWHLGAGVVMVPRSDDM